MKLSKLLLLTAVLGVVLSGGIHRVCQSRFDTRDSAEISTLSLFFALDNALATGSYVYVDMPAGVTVSGCAFWALGDDTDAPDALSASWITGSYSSGICTTLGALAANTAYGMQLGASVSGAGVYAPIGLSTALTNDLGTAATLGPCVDSNPVFDSAFSLGSPDSTTTLAVAVVVTDPVTSSVLPSDSYLVDFTFTFAFDEGEMVAAPYWITLDLGCATDRTQQVDSLGDSVGQTW